MAEKKNVPQVRFNDFTEEWVPTKIENTFVDYIEKTVVQNQYPVLTSSQQKGIVLQQEYFADRQVTTNDNIGYFVLPRGYFTFRSRSDNDVFVFNRNDIVDKGIISYFYPVFNVTGADSNFFLRRVNHGIKHQLAIAAEGTGQHVLSLKKFKEIITLFPKEKEQQKIGELFEHMDMLIGDTQSKLEKLQNLRLSMLEKMFPRDGADIPEIRFKDFTEGWKEYSFENITFPSGTRNSDNIQYESYSITNEAGFVPQNEQFSNGGTMKDADKRMYIIVEPNSFAYNPARINVGSIGYQHLDHNVIVSSLYEVFKTTGDCHDRFLWYWFKTKTFRKMIEQLQEGGVRLYFYYDKLCKCSIKMPNIAEQTRIAEYFEKLDELIFVCSKELDKLQSLKKGLLGKMFV